jgi:hypothetical protein
MSPSFLSRFLVFLLPILSLLFPVFSRSFCFFIFVFSLTATFEARSESHWTGNDYPFGRLLIELFLCLNTAVSPVQ